MLFDRPANCVNTALCHAVLTDVAQFIAAQLIMGSQMRRSVLNPPKTRSVAKHRSSAGFQSSQVNSVRITAHSRYAKMVRRVMVFSRCLWRFFCDSRAMAVMIPGSPTPPNARLLGPTQERWASPRYFRVRISINRDDVRSVSAPSSALANSACKSACADKISFTRRS